MTFEVILYFMKNLRLHNVSIHRKFYQNRFINEYGRKKKAKISESRSHGITEFFLRDIEELTLITKGQYIFVRIFVIHQLYE